MMPSIGMGQAPIIRQQPESLLIAPGTTAIFDVIVDAASTNVRYQWRLNGGNLPGENRSLLALSNVQFSAAGRYTVVAYNDFGATTSDPAQLMLNNILSFPFSDAFAEAVALTPSLGGRFKGSNEGATTEAGEPLHFGKLARRSVWTKWTPTSGGIATFRTAGSGFDTILGVYTGSEVWNLTEVGSDDDGNGFLTSQVRFQAEPGTNYYIAISGFGSAAGQFVLDWRLEPNAGLLPVFTLQPFDQAVGPGSNVIFAVDGDADSSWQWYLDGQPIAGATTRILLLDDVSIADVGTYFCRASLRGLSHDSRPARLQFNFDDLGRVQGQVFSSEKLLDARGIVNDFRSGANPSRRKAVARGFSGTQVFSTVGSSKEIGEPNHCGVAGGASEWFAVQAETDGTLCINTDGSNFDTILAVYTGPGDEFGTLVSVACDNNSGLDGKDSRVIFPATAETIYWIAVDGVNQPSNGNPARGSAVLNFRLVLPLHLTTTRHTSASGGKLTFQVTGTPHLPATIESSTDLGTAWIPLFTNASPSGVFQYTNVGANLPCRMFRAVNRL